MDRTIRTAVALALAGLMAACSGGGSGAATSFTVKTTEFAFEPETVTVAAGRDVQVTVDNSSGVVEHDFTLDEADTTVLAAASETASGTINVPAGAYTFYCSVPGHREAGMEGSLAAE